MNQNLCRHAGCRLKPIWESEYCWTHQKDKASWRSHLEGHARRSTEIRDANFFETGLRGLMLSGIKALHSDFTSADFSGSSVKDSSFKGSVFRRSILNKADFSNADMSDCICDGMTASELKGVKIGFSSSQARHVHAPSSDFSGSDFRNADWTCSDLSDSNLSEISANSWTAPWINLEKARLFRSDLEFAVLAGANLSEVNAEEAIFQRANLNGMRSFNGNFSHVNFYYARLANSLFENANLSHCNINRTVFRAALLINSNLEGANREAAIWDRSRFN